jgi:hypothetical protein
MRSRAGAAITGAAHPLLMLGAHLKTPKPARRYC